MEKNHQRWHDKKTELAKSIHFLASLPNDIQSVISDCVIKVAEKEYKVLHLLNDLKSLGPEKALGLHQSQKKRRDSDKNPTAQKAINHIYILPESEQSKLAKQVLALMNCVFNYFEIHKTLNAPVTKESLQQLADAFTEGGSKKANHFNLETRKKIQESLSKPEHLKDAKGGLIIQQ